MIHFPTGTKCTIKSRSYEVKAWWNELNKDQPAKNGADLYQFIDEENGMIISKNREEFINLYESKIIKNIKL